MVYRIHIIFKLFFSDFFPKSSFTALMLTAVAA